MDTYLGFLIKFIGVTLFIKSRSFQVYISVTLGLYTELAFEMERNQIYLANN